MTVECHNSSETAAAFARVKRDGRRVLAMSRMKGNNAGWILHLSDPPAQHEMFDSKPVSTQKSNSTSNTLFGVQNPATAWSIGMAKTAS